MMIDALIGFSGFVGQTLLRQTNFGGLYRSTNVAEIAGREFGTVVCAGAPAQKWLANRDPEGDRQAIGGLIKHLSKVRCRTMILISTVDVFRDPAGVDEDTPVEEAGLHAYGLHRRWLEKEVQDRFPEHLVVRLPGLVGPGLKKNIIFDFHNDNNVAAIESRSVFQFYPMVNLWFDIRRALEARLRLVHLTSEPVSVAEIAHSGFGRAFSNEVQAVPARYDMRSRHAELLGAPAGALYQYSRREELQAVRAYAQSEPRAARAREEQK